MREGWKRNAHKPGRNGEIMQTEDTKGSIFLTGITGGLGCWFAKEAILKGARIVALVRAENEEVGRERVRATLEIAGDGDLADEVEVVCGDICAANAVEELSAAVPDHVTRIVHSAASTQFYELYDERSYQTNVEGTRRIMGLAEKRDLSLIHVSSAYVAGKRTGIVMEDELDEGQDFNNGYEHTKFLSEMDVRHWAERTGRGVTILRPSIVMGDSATGSTVKFNGIYDFVRVIDIVILDVVSEGLRVATEGKATKNIIPLDYFAKAAWHIVSNGLDGCFHLTNPEPPTMRQLGEIFCEAFAYEGQNYRLVEYEDFAEHPPTGLEQMILDATERYRHYMTLEPVFDRTHTIETFEGTGIEVSPIDGAYVGRLLNYAHQVKWGKLHRKVQ